MTLSLNAPGRRMGFAVLALVLAASYLYSSGTVFYASRLGLSTRVADLERATHLQPLNARYHFLLANHYLLVESNTPAAIRELHLASALDPHDSSYWLALARTYLFQGDLSAQQQAIEHALQVDPTTPEVAWEAANFYIVRNEPDKALHCLRVVIENDPEATARSANLAWRAFGDVRTIMAEGLPPRADSYLALLREAVQAKDAEAADQVWDRTYALNQPIAPGGAFPYLQLLIEARHVSRAQQVWRQMLDRTPALQPYQWSDNLVVNSSFEYELLNGGFDWRLQPIPFVNLDLDNLNFRHGRQSLSVAFETYSPALIGLTQYVPVEPSTRYVFRAFVKAEDLESASGPRFAIDDAYTKARLGISDETVGNTPWVQRSFEFTTGPAASLVVLTVVRDPADRLIRGKFWTDDISITKRQD